MKRLYVKYVQLALVLLAMTAAAGFIGANMGCSNAHLTTGEAPEREVSIPVIPPAILERAEELGIDVTKVKPDEIIKIKPQVIIPTELANTIMTDLCPVLESSAMGANLSEPGVNCEAFAAVNLENVRKNEYLYDEMLNRFTDRIIGLRDEEIIAQFRPAIRKLLDSSSGIDACIRPVEQAVSGGEYVMDQPAEVEVVEQSLTAEGERRIFDERNTFIWHLRANAIQVFNETAATEAELSLRELIDGDLQRIETGALFRREKISGDLKKDMLVMGNLLSVRDIYYATEDQRSNYTGQLDDMLKTNLLRVYDPVAGATAISSVDGTTMCGTINTPTTAEITALVPSNERLGEFLDLIGLASIPKVAAQEEVTTEGPTETTELPNLDQQEARIDPSIICEPACPVGEICISGTCSAIGCATSNDCPAGFVCIENLCVSEDFLMNMGKD